MSQSIQSFELKKAIVKELLKRLSNESIDSQRVSDIASYTINIIPENLNEQSMKLLIPKLDDKYSELAPIVYKYLKDQENKQKQDAVIKKMERLIKFGKIEEAITVGKKQPL